MNSTSDNITRSELPYIFTYDPIRLFIFTTYFTIGGLITLIGNGLVVFLTTIHEQFHEPYMYIRAAFSILDITGLVIQMPFIMLHMFGHQNPERVWCLFSSISSGLWFSTVHLTAYLALERYFYFCRPLIYNRLFTTKTTILAISANVIVTQIYMLSTEFIYGRELQVVAFLCQLTGYKHAIFQVCQVEFSIK